MGAGGHRGGGGGVDVVWTGRARSAAVEGGRLGARRRRGAHPLAAPPVGVAPAAGCQLVRVGLLVGGRGRGAGCRGTLRRRGGRGRVRGARAAPRRIHGVRLVARGVGAERTAHDEKCNLLTEPHLHV